jgi:predicted MFS family arabinose efflux permease
LKSAQIATYLAFFAAGFGVSCWAPLIPFAKQRLHLDEGSLGMLLLSLGVGSVVAMLFSSRLIHLFGVRPVVTGGGLGMAALLPILAAAGSRSILASALFGFGGCLGLMDVAMNIHALEVEKRTGRPQMSGFHGLFSVGGFAGSAVMTMLLTRGILPLPATLACAAGLLICTLILDRGLLRSSEVPHGIVVLLALLAATMFLVEGAILDWGALFMTESGFARPESAGVAFLLFSVAMTAGRLSGDYINARAGDRAVLLWGGIVAAGGFTLTLVASGAGVAGAGFFVIGLGAANIVPVLIRLAGAQTAMPAALAVAAVTTAGYGGQLLGPAGVGFVAKAIGLKGAFWMLAGLIALVPLSSGSVTRTTR